MIQPEDEKLMAEVRADPVAFQLLKDKCAWEGMSQYAVLKEWGDPREWASYEALKGGSNG